MKSPLLNSTHKAPNFRCSQAKVKGPRIFLGPFVRLIAYKYAALHLEAAGYNKFPQQTVHFLVYLGRYQLYALFFLKIGFCLCFVYAFLQFVKAAKLVDIGFRQPQTHHIAELFFIQAKHNGKAVDLVILRTALVLGDVIPQRLAGFGCGIAAFNIVQEDIGKLLFFLCQAGKGLMQFGFCLFW